MKKNILKIVFASAFALVASYSVYASLHKVEMSDFAMANVEALARNEGGIKECVGCVVTSNNLCKTYGDWGACVGESDGTVKQL